MIEKFDSMYPITITLAVALAVAGFYLGRTNILFGRLRRLCRKSITRAQHAEDELRIFRGAFLSIQNPSLEALNYIVASTGTAEYSVFMRKPLPRLSRPAGDAYVDIPVKTFCDYEDPAFARREAEEFAEICRQN